MCSIGKEPFSEPESRNIRDILLSLGNRIHALFDIQSYGQFWLTPYGYTRHTPDFHSEMVRKHYYLLHEDTSVISNVLYPS